MNIRKTRKEDVPVIMDLYENAKAFMRSKGNLTQWNDGYPSVEIITEDIDNGNSYVFVENDEIVGTFAFIIGEDPTYQVIEDGEWHSSKIYGTIHRIASSGKAKGWQRPALITAVKRLIISELIRMKITSRCRMRCSDMGLKNAELYTSGTEVKESGI